MMSVGDLIGSGRGELGRFYDYLQLLEQLQLMLYQHWPELASAKVRVVNMRRGTLTLGTPSSGAAVRIRHALPEIIHSLQNEPLTTHLKLTKIIIRHRHQQPAPSPQALDDCVVTPPSSEALAKLKSLGESSKSPVLKEAFRKLVLKLEELNEYQ